MKTWLKNNWLRSSLASLLLVLPMLAFISHRAWFPVLGDWLDIGEPPTRTDYILVLNGDMNTRPFVAAALAKQGYAEKVIVTKVKLAPQWEKSPWPAEHEVVRQILLARGVQEERIIMLESACDATHDEAVVVHQFLQSQPSATITVVTSDYHTRRTRWVFREVFGQRAGNLRFVSAPTEGFNASNWWRREDSFVLYWQEFAKFAFYWLYHGRGMYLVGYCGALLLTGYGMYRWKTASNGSHTSLESPSAAENTSHSATTKVVLS